VGDAADAAEAPTSPPVAGRRATDIAKSSDPTMERSALPSGSSVAAGVR
jgi:hypothetical protein